MSLIVPKIIYPTGGGTTLTFVYPPRNVPYSDRGVERHDNVSSSGVVERVYERTDNFFVLQMDHIKAGSDAAAWDAFIASALQGVAFSYYPDSTNSSHTDYTLEDKRLKLAFKQLGMYSLTATLRKVV